MHRFVKFISLLITTMALVGCYHSNPNGKVLPSTASSSTQTHEVAGYNLDSVSEMQNFNYEFYKTHHYAQNYNFVVRKDSIYLLKQQPEEMLSNMETDSFAIKKNSHIVVADIKILKDDPIDSVWIEIASDQYEFGWIHESELLKSVVPDDPISQFILTFSDVHLLIFLIIISLIAGGYVVYRLQRRKVKVVHFDDIDSFYPTLLAITVAAAATFYSSIQLFAPDTWHYFYFHPTLNPFALSPILAVFLISVWSMMIILIATIDDVYHKLSPTAATLYLCRLAAVCAANYIIFSITTLYYIGYVILVAYIYYALRIYARNNYFKYVCGNCRAKLHKKGECPKCGAMNS